MKILVFVLVLVVFGDCQLPVTDQELKAISEELFRIDNNNVFQYIELGNRNPLIRNVEPPALQKPTLKALKQLFDAYEQVGQPHLREKQEEFLNAVMNTEIMKKTMIFLQNKGYNFNLRGKLDEIWFTRYRRRIHNPQLSSGFEHTFVGEVIDGSVTGLHNWLSFYRKEHNGVLINEQLKRIKDLHAAGRKASLLLTEFAWGNEKKLSSFFVGTSPELELAAYTICFFTRLDKRCPVKMGNVMFAIQTHEFKSNGKNLVGTAYPLF